MPSGTPQGSFTFCSLKAHQAVQFVDGEIFKSKNNTNSKKTTQHSQRYKQAQPFHQTFWQQRGSLLQKQFCSISRSNIHVWQQPLSSFQPDYQHPTPPHHWSKNLQLVMVKKWLWYWYSTVIHFWKPGYSSKRSQFVELFLT